MTSYRRINSRTLNNAVRQQDNMVTFMKPISRATYPTYFSVPDASNNSLLVSTGSTNSASASNKLTFDGATFSIDGNIDVGNIDVTGILDITGTFILKSSFVPIDSSDNGGVLGQFACDLSYIYVCTGRTGRSRWGRTDLSYNW
jgi:hypothetical protein